MTAFGELRSQLAALLTYQKNWDSYDADPPNALVMERMRTILNEMEVLDIHASRVVASSQSGAAISWSGEFGAFNGSRYAHIECCNDGSVTAVASDHKLPANELRVWWITEFTNPEGEAGYSRPGEGELQLTLAESLEHIRCFIWANYE